MIDSELNEHRKKASDQSLGLSHQVIYEKAITLLSSVLVKEGCHLDFGSGQGSLLALLLNKHPEVEFYGSDLMGKPEALDKKIQWVSEDLNKTLSFQDNQFDSLSAIEIIEHLENPRHIFRELYRVLKPGGTLILSTPNNESWRALVSYVKRGHFVAFTDRSYPAHITALNRKDLLRAADEAGFQFCGWSMSGQGCLPGLTKLSWQKISFGLCKGIRYSDNIFIKRKK